MLVYRIGKAFILGSRFEIILNIFRKKILNPIGKLYNFKAASLKALTNILTISKWVFPINVLI